MNIIFVIIITVENVVSLKDFRRLIMPVKVVKLKDTHIVFVNYNGYLISCAVDRIKCSNNFCIEINTKEEKQKFIKVLDYFKKELERLEF